MECILCHHDKWVDENGRCKHLLPVEPDQLYTERVCGCRCKFKDENQEILNDL